MCDQDIRDDMPPGWWLAANNEKDNKNNRNNKNCFYLLAALVHRNNPDVIPEATDADAGESRAIIRKKVKDQRASDVAMAKSGQQTTKGKIEESMMSAKAALMKQSIELQDIQGVREQLLMMKEFKSSFVNIHNKDSGVGDAEYDETVCDMLSALPIMKKRKAKEGGDISSVTSSMGN